MRFLKGFFYAGRGIGYAFLERNFRFHICAAALVLFFGIRFYSFTKAEWGVLLLCCALVLALEAVNASVERLCDKICPEKDELIKKCKDIAAGAVLIAAIISAVIGVMMFWDADRLSLIVVYFSEPVKLALLLLVLFAMWCFVFLLPTKRKK